MIIVFINNFFVGFMVSEIPRVSVFGHCPYSVTFPYIYIYIYIYIFITYEYIRTINTWLYAYNCISLHRTRMTYVVWSSFQ